MAMIVASRVAGSGERTVDIAEHRGPDLAVEHASAAPAPTPGGEAPVPQEQHFAGSEYVLGLAEHPVEQRASTSSAPGQLEHPDGSVVASARGRVPVHDAASDEAS